MTQEEKQLLLIDLCARLSYETHVYIEFKNGNILDDTMLNAQYIHDWMAVPSCQNMAIKPYLRPMSSMTEEEKKELKEEHKKDERVYAEVLEKISKGDESARGTAIPHFAADWCNANHFDYRGLIPMNLALEAKEGMYQISKY